MDPDFQEWRSFAVTNPGQEPFNVTLRGHNLWTMRRVITAGCIGCTPIDNPAPRWSGYVRNLREHGVAIDTLTEKHSGPFAGWHGRYVLLSRVEPIDGTEGAA